MRVFQLVGGPFDGAHGDFVWDNDPPVVWAYPDPSSPGPFKGALTDRQRPGAFPYNLSEVSDSNLTYVFSNLSDAGYLFMTEGRPSKIAAVYDWETDGA